MPSAANAISACAPCGCSPMGSTCRRPLCCARPRGTAKAGGSSSIPPERGGGGNEADHDPVADTKSLVSSGGAGLVGALGAEGLAALLKSLVPGPGFIVLARGAGAGAPGV